jgi:hypothetical protein
MTREELQTLMAVVCSEFLLRGQVREEVVWEKFSRSMDVIENNQLIVAN